MCVRHVKITEHFLQSAQQRLEEQDIARLWRVLSDGRLFKLAEKLRPGEKGAVGIGSGYVIFCEDSEDAGLLALLTLLGRGSSDSIQRRRDTRLMRLPSSTTDMPKSSVGQISSDLEVYEWGNGVVIEPAGTDWRLELSVEEARKLSEDLRIMTGEVEP